MHLWRIALPAALEAGRARRLATMLPEEDLARCGLYRLPAARARALAARAALRGVLGACLGVSPREVPLGEGGGKPRLADELQSDLDFSLSHSVGLALLAVGRQVRVGADLERVRLAPFMEEVAERFFGEEERRELGGARGAGRRQAFFRLWTRREAAAKAQGLGILEHFVRFPEWSGPAPRGDPWSLVELRPARGYLGALCREGRAPISGFWLWREPQASS